MSDPDVVFRADGGSRLGMGHLYKIAILAKELRRKRPHLSCFVLLRKDGEGLRWLKARGVKCLKLPAALSAEAEPAWILSRVRMRPGALIVTDILDVSARYVATLQKAGHPVLTFENRGSSRGVADATVNAIVEGVTSKSRGRLFTGAAYRIFNREYQRVKRNRRGKAVLVTLGGGDDGGFSMVLLKALARENPEALVKCVRGPAQAAVKSKMPRGIKVLRPQPSLARLFAASDVAVTAGGGTLYEAAYSGVPAVAFHKVRHQKRNIRFFVSAGAALAAGAMTRSNAERAAREVKRLLADRGLLRHMSAAGRRLVDGRGLDRVVKIIFSLIERGIKK